jgi:hypothetical protein
MLEEEKSASEERKRATKFSSADRANTFFEAWPTQPTYDARIFGPGSNCLVQIVFFYHCSRRFFKVLASMHTFSKARSMLTLKELRLTNETEVVSETALVAAPSSSPRGPGVCHSVASVPSAHLPRPATRITPVTASTVAKGRTAARIPTGERPTYRPNTSSSLISKLRRGCLLTHGPWLALCRLTRQLLRLLGPYRQVHTALVPAHLCAAPP